MPPKTTTPATNPASGKTASIPNRSKDVNRVTAISSNKTTSSGGGVGGKPNKDAYSYEQDKLRREIDLIQTKLTNLKVQIGDPKNGGNHGTMMERRKVLREELDALRDEQSRGKSSRGMILDQVKSSNETVQRKIKDLNSTRGKLPYKSTVEVDAKIRQLEAQIESGTMRIVEEKKALAEIQNLRKARKLVESFGPQQDAIEAEKERVDSLRKKLDDPDQKSTSERWAQIKAELEKLNDKLAETSKSRDKLFEERNKLQDQLNVLYEKKRESALRYKDANDKYYTKMQDDQQRRIDREKADKDAFEADQITEIHEEMRAQAAAPAYEREIEDCRTLIIFFDKMLGNNPTIDESSEPLNKTSSSTNEGTATSSLPKLKELRKVDGEDAFQGMIAVKKKGAEDDDFFMAGGGGKKGKKNKKTNASNPESNNPNGNSSLHLPLSTINALHALAVSVPMNKKDVVETISALSEKKKWFSENQERVTKERIKETEEKIAIAE
ncbi:hypothetical protein BY996DRAFT_4528900, partial [Phakopsora pachyrhizi]